MSHLRQFVLNGKFLTAESTGVHRVAEQLALNIHTILQQDFDIASRLQVELWVPPSATDRASRLGIPYRTVGPLDGIAWEQLTLPARVGNKTILSLCNVGPVAARNAVTMFHDAQVHITPESYRPAFRYWYRFHQPLAGRRHRRILTVSDFSRGQLLDYGLGRKGKVGVVLNGADHVLDTPADTAILPRLKLRNRSYVIGLANTQKHKNIALLLEAFASPALNDIDLVLFGSAKASDFESRGCNVPDNVCFAGRVSDEELRALYENALCIAFPSTTEGFGLPPLEAMFLGCPAIVAPAGALPESCGTGAIYADPAYRQDWVDAIRALADKPGFREEKVRDSREWSAQFTWRNAASHLIAELLEL
ncbi:MAG: glycosyltransferase family 4 protein [Sphingomonadaceae bacterium]